MVEEQDTLCMHTLTCRLKLPISYQKAVRQLKFLPNLIQAKFLSSTVFILIASILR